MFFSIIVPIYNVEMYLRKCIDSIVKQNFKDYEVLLIDDCSTDGTREVLKNEIEPIVHKVIYHKKNRGKGGALKTGIKYATGDVVIIQDADMEYNPKEYPNIVNAIFENQADVVYGSRFLRGGVKGYLRNYLANKFLTFLSNCKTGLKLTDMETCYKAFKREIIQSINIEEMRFGFEPEITAKIAKQGIKIKEVPIKYYPRKNSEGKKIGFKDGIRAIICIWKY